ADGRLARAESCPGRRLTPATRMASVNRNFPVLNFIIFKPAKLPAIVARIKLPPHPILSWICGTRYPVAPTFWVGTCRAEARRYHGKKSLNTKLTEVLRALR